jgi:hypothetical protein
VHRFAGVQPTAATALAGVAWRGDGPLRTWPVDQRVGSPRNNRPELLVGLVVGSGRAAKPLLVFTSEETPYRKQPRPGAS